MLFVALAKVKAGTTMERVARRLEWQPPEGSRLVAEYWLQSENPQVINVFEADSIAPIMAATSEWNDVYEITVIPACTAEEGLQLARQRLQK